MSKIEITYSGGKIIPELDKVIRETMEAKGYKNWASGMGTETGIRDLAFDKKI